MHRKRQKETNRGRCGSYRKRRDMDKVKGEGSRHRGWDNWDTGEGDAE